MKITLNIGLAREGKPNLTADEVLDALKTAGLLVGQNTIVQSDTEPTLVVEVWMDPSVLIPAGAAIHQVAAALDQDCIAVYLGGGVGKLIGPRAEAWGEFNPAYFIDIDGNRLA